MVAGTEGLIFLRFHLRIRHCLNLKRDFLFFLFEVPSGAVQADDPGGDDKLRVLPKVSDALSQPLKITHPDDTQ